ncbi:AAA family ATPase [Vulcanococcus sp. Clear-D1]|uniref:AAA family ATPase n=1 Tax=Vulcanococcus sp. Clear-D1 TaxID=2766970 RepID=UPI0019842FEB|nr:AAA family ATPase [Vulcanococcus sp. Clear-D1]MBD1192636.1 AAA family ATPase [Vulcanococcus sp. Clear-D1]
MRLIACRLQNVRRHRDLELCFGRELTLIAGANETGKSTLVEALHKTLFLRATATGRGVDELRSRLHPGLPDVEIRFEANAETWRLRKRFAGASGTCQISNGSGVALSGAQAEELLAQLLGYEAPVEGRRIAQLPERWAHLWVRQGDAGLNPFSGSQERYDHQRLVAQLQQQSSQSPLQSSTDRLVMEQIQQEVNTLYTATGKVKAGSPLAGAQQRSQEAAAALALAEQQVGDLEAAMEQWRSITERLETIEHQQRPALQRELHLQQQTQLLQAQLDPLLQRQNERQQLLMQQRQEQQELLLVQQQLHKALQQQQQDQAQRQQLQEQIKQASAARQELSQRLEQVQRLLDLQQLEDEARQLREHQQQLQQLQEQAEGLKQQLAALPEITAAQVRQLRQAEQVLAQATARCEAMAAGLEVLAADQPIQLNGETLVSGERRRIEAAAELTVGSGVRLQISPGGGQALPQALEQQRQCCQQLEQLQQLLKLSSSDQAETIERQRTELERELNNLRQAAKTIPWSGLQQRLEQLEPRLKLLAAALEGGAIAPVDPVQLRTEQESLRQRSSEVTRSQENSNQQLLELEQNQLIRQTAQEQLRGRCGQLEGSLQVLGERLLHLQSAETVGGELEVQQQELRALRAELEQLQSARHHGGAANTVADAAGQLEALEQEKDRLLSQLGQAQQRTQSLGAANPLAELEQRQVAWEEAEAERAALEQRGMALRLLLERFHRAQSNLANRYSEPLRAAITPYLAELASEPHQPLLAFDPQQGFHDLQLRQGEEAFAFERLSGGMREQLGATVRLAMAEVLKPAYADALPLVFDDAFTNSDRERLLGLRRMLERGIQQGIQIVLLTCHPDDYTALLPDSTWREPEQPRGQKNPPEVIGGKPERLDWSDDRVIVKLD